MNKSKKLRELINSNQLEFIMEAHNGISCKIVEKIVTTNQGLIFL